MFSYAHLPRFAKAKQDTIGVIRGANAKLPYHRGCMIAYLVENDAMGCRGCGCIFKNDKSLNGRI
jgi:hypothetical protein